MKYIGRCRNETNVQGYSRRPPAIARRAEHHARRRCARAGLRVTLGRCRRHVPDCQMSTPTLGATQAALRAKHCGLMV
jgi:hypothetical protein